MYTTDDEIREIAIDEAIRAGVSVAFNLVGGRYVNQPAPFSDFSGSGANPAGNASMVDVGFVASRFGVVGIRASV